MCVVRVMLEHSKAALVIALSALERKTRIFDAEREPKLTSPPLPSQFSLSALAGLAVIAKDNKTWPQCVCVCVCV